MNKIMESNEQNKRSVGRPKLEYTMNPEWYNIIVEAGKNGKHITQFLMELGISWEGYHALLKRNKKFSEAVHQYKILCEQYWFNMAHKSMSDSGGNGFNSRLWSLMVRNMFPENWSESSKIDVTSKGDKINQDSSIQVEIIRKSIDDEGKV
jgi:hypothetical protein